MGLIKKIKQFFARSHGITYIEVMMSVSLLAIAMTYISYDSRYSAKFLYQSGEKDKMVLAAQQVMEKFKLEQAGGVKDINGYTVDVEVTGDPDLDSNLVPDLKRVKVTVHPKNTNSGLSDFVLFSYALSIDGGPPNVPQNLVATPTAKTIVLDWDSALYATSYTVKRRESQSSPYTVIASNVALNTYTDTTAEVGKIYYYVVSALNDKGESLNSVEASAIIINNSIHLNPVEDSYIRGGWIYSSQNYGTSGNLFIQDKNQSSNKYKSYLKFDLSAVTGTVMSVKLRLCGTASSNIPAQINTLSDDSWTETGITWNNAPLEGSGITTVTLGSTMQYVEADVTNYCKDALTGDKIASFVVTTTSGTRGTITSRESANQPELVITTVPVLPPPAPANLTAVPGDQQVSLAWGHVNGAEHYNVKRAFSSGGPYTEVGSPATESYTDTGLTNGTTYYYVVSAENSTGEGNLSNEASATPNPITTVTFNPEADSYVRDGTYSTTNYGASAKIEVKKSVSSPAEHRIGYLRFNLGSIGGDVINAKLRLYGNNTEDSSLVSLGAYEVTDNSWKEDTINFSNAPAVGSEIGSAAVNNLMSYKEFDITSYVSSKMQGDKIVNIAVDGKDLEKLVSFNSKESLADRPELVIEKTIARPEAPTGLSATPDDRKVFLNWSAAPETDGYNIKRSTTDGGPYTTIATNVTSTSYTDSSVSNGTTYYYVVSAKNICGESPNSNQASATPNTTITVTLDPIADARVESYYPGSNYGTSSLLNVINDGVNNKKSYIKFNLAGYTNDTPVSAKLRIYGNSSEENFQINAYGVSNDAWVESGTWGITWNNAPALESVEGNTIMGSSQQYYEIDITPYLAKRMAVSSLVSVGLFTNIQSGVSDSINSREASANTPQLVVKMVEGVPKPPQNFQGTGGNRAATLTWNSSDGASSYRIKRSSTSGGPYTTIASGLTALSYQNTGLRNGSEYYYVVTAVNAKGESGNSNEVCVIPGWSGSTKTLLPSDDAYAMDGVNAGNNYGGENSIQVSGLASGKNAEGYIQFDLSALNGNISSAVLSFSGVANTNKGSVTLLIGEYLAASDNWEEYTLNWNNRPGATGSMLGLAVVGKQGGNYTLDLTNYVRTAMAGDKKISICLTPWFDTGGATASFDSSESANPPLLSITY